MLVLLQNLAPLVPLFSPNNVAEIARSWKHMGSSSNGRCNIKQLLQATLLALNQLPLQLVSRKQFVSS